ncbi:hypothetical protein J1614_005171 [Plenodomus biglobosus]|nr:hypothetical protein J1614_005171 [Plenodomus biglobosus]
MESKRDSTCWTGETLLLTLHRARDSYHFQQPPSPRSPRAQPKQNLYSPAILSNSTSGEDREHAPGNADSQEQGEQAPRLPSPGISIPMDKSNWKESNRTTLAINSATPSRLC